MTLNKTLTSILCLVAFAAPALAQKDVIHFKNAKRKPQEGTILDETYKGVVVKIGSAGKTERSWEEIDRIDYAKEPSELAEAKNRISQGDYEGALSFLNRARSKKPRKIFLQQILFHSGRASESMGSVDEAIKIYNELLSTFPKSRYLIKGNERIVACLVSRKKYSEAQKAIISARTEAEKIGGEVARNFDLMEAELKWTEKKLGDAAKAYQKLSGATSDKALAGLAKIRAAQCQFEQSGKAGAVKKVFEDAIKGGTAETSPIVMAAAWNGMGQIQLADGRKSRNPEKLQEALFSFLRGVIQYFPGENDRTSEYERSLYYTSLAYQSISEVHKDEAVQKRSQARAAEKKNELQLRFPLSPFNKR